MNSSKTCLKSAANIQLRLMQPADCPAIADLQATLDYSGWSEKQWLEALDHYPCAWVLSSESCPQVESRVKSESSNKDSSATIIGYLIYQTSVSQFEILNLGIKSSYQGRGIASEFLEATIKLLPANAESIFLEVRRSNVPAINLYEKLGFQSVGIRRDYYASAGGLREDAIIYRYDI